MYENKRRNKFVIEYPKLFATDRHWLQIMVTSGYESGPKDKVKFSEIMLTSFEEKTGWANKAQSNQWKRITVSVYEL